MADVSSGDHTVAVRLVFADRGNFHTETVRLSLGEEIDGERLLDLLRDGDAVTPRLYLDAKRLVLAYIVAEDAEAETPR